MQFSHNFIEYNQELQVLLFNEIQNINDVQEYLEQKNLTKNCLFLNPQYIVSIQALLIAANRCVKGNKDIISMLVYHLCPEVTTPSDRELFKMDNQSIKSEPTLCVFVNVQDQNIKEIKTMIKGNLQNIADLDNFTDIKKIINLYKISEVEQQLDSDIRGSVYNQLALKKFK